MKGKPESHVPVHHRLTVRLTGGVVLVLLLIGLPFLLAFHRLLRNQQLEALSEATTSLSQIMVDGLRSAMLVGQPHLLDDTVRNIAREKGVERVIILDHRGRVRVTSDRAYEGRILDRAHDSTCAVCHGKGGAPPSSRAAVTEEGGRRVFRAMSAIPNEERCHGCHEPALATNGILLMDLSLSTADRRFFANIGGTLALGTLMVVLTVAVLVLLLRRMVHNPLGAVVSTSRKIVDGNLDARVPAAGPGEFTLLASQVNRMTDHLAQSLRTVEAHRRELQAVLDSVDDEIVVLDRDQRVVAANKAFMMGSGRPEVDPTGRPCHEASSSHWPCRSEVQGGCPVRRVFESGRLQKAIFSSTGPDGKERSIEIHASPLRGVDGVVSQAVEVRRDISERRQMEATLAHSEHLAALGLLASGLSHEINNPLGAIAASVEGLRRRLPGESGISPESVRDLESVLGRVAQEVERGRKITHRLLKVARPLGAARSLVDVNQVVEEIVGILAHEMRRSNVAAELDLGERLPPLIGDESSLGQIVMNLALNAIQAMTGAGGKLRIATSAADGGVQIDVEDSGCGIPPEHLKRIYEPFFTTKPVGKGTGLGLFITHRIISEIGGSVDVKSNVGHGTLFKVRLPRGESRDRP